MEDPGQPRQTHRFTLPNSYFVATAPSRILCPQHLAQMGEDNYPLPLGTGEVTGDEYIQLFWIQRKYIKTIKLDSRRNIGVRHTAPGIHKFKEFVAQQAVQIPCPCCFETHVIPDDDDEVSLSHWTQFTRTRKRSNLSFLCNKAGHR